MRIREQCVREMNSMPFDGFAVGGLGVGEGRSYFIRLPSTAGLLPTDRPRYLMGVGGRRISLMSCAPVLICSIVSCRRATLAMARSLPRKASSASSAPNSPAIRDRWMRLATAIAVVTFLGLLAPSVRRRRNPFIPA